MSRDLDPATVLALVSDGKLTLLDRPAWLDGRNLDDLHAANGGCMNAAMRIAGVLAHDWTWRVGYDNLAELAWRQDASIRMRVISLSQAHALLIGALQAQVMGPQGVKAAMTCDADGAVVGDPQADTK